MPEIISTSPLPIISGGGFVRCDALGQRTIDKEQRAIVAPRLRVSSGTRWEKVPECWLLG
jgi:hypothetical protein